MVEDVVDEIGVFKLLGEDVLLGLEESEAEPNGVFNVVKAIGFTTLGEGAQKNRNKNYIYI